MQVKLSEKSLVYYNQIDENTKLGDLRKMAKQIKMDHQLALELWSTGELLPQHLAILILDKKLLSIDLIQKIDNDIRKHSYSDRNQLIDWLMANQLSKNKKTISLMESWENSRSSLQRRIFWYYQARLRWMGKTDQTNTEYLLDSIESNLMKEEPEVQWAMNFTAGQIGKWQEKYRKRCIAIGEYTGLYKNEVVPKNCTPSYLPAFIEIEVAKLNK